MGCCPVLNKKFTLINLEANNIQSSKIMEKESYLLLKKLTENRLKTINHQESKLTKRSDANLKKRILF